MIKILSKRNVSLSCILLVLIKHMKKVLNRQNLF